MNNKGVTGRILPPNILTLILRALGLRNSAYAFWTTAESSSTLYVGLARAV